MGYALRPRKKWTKDNSSLGAGQFYRATRSLLDELLRTAADEDVDPTDIFDAMCARGDPAVDIDIVRRLAPDRSRYFFIRSLTGSLTFSILSISTLSSRPPTFSTRRM